MLNPAVSSGSAHIRSHARATIPGARQADRFDVDGKLLFAILSAEAIAFFVARLPGVLQFTNFAFFDTGANLTVQYLTSHGYRPAIDFSYFYGLLPVLFGRLWFGLFGLTPRACVALVPLFDLLIVWGLVRFVKNVKSGWAGTALMVLNGPMIIPSAFLNLTHAIEPIFMIHALADQAAGNRRRALALATACVFVKPSMAFFLGFVLVMLILFRAVRSGTSPLVETFRQTWPAAAVGSAIAAALAIVYGFGSLVRTVFPLGGESAYRAQGFGFFNGAGRLFLAPSGAPWTFYLANPAGPWLLYTVALGAAAIFAARSLASADPQGPRSGPSREAVAICAFLHFSFLAIFFGNEFSWLYYFYVPVLGLAAASRFGPGWKLIALAIALTMPASKLSKAVIVRMAAHEPRAACAPSSGADARPVKIPALPEESGFTVQLWRSTRPAPETAGLWASRSEREDWKEVLALTRGRSTAVLEWYGCAPLLFPQLLPPVSLYVVQGGINRPEMAREINQLKSSEMVVMARWQSGILDEQPEIGKLIKGDFLIGHGGPAFIVFVRKPH